MQPSLKSSADAGQPCAAASDMQENEQIAPSNATLHSYSVDLRKDISIDRFDV